MFSRLKLTWAISVIGVVFAISIYIGFSAGIALAECNDDDLFTTAFRLQDCRWFETVGKNPYFILIPGYKSVLESEEVRAVVTVLRDTQWIDLRAEGLGWIKTRVVEEREYERDGEEEVLIEISRNFFGICKNTNDVYYFGEDVKIFEYDDEGNLEKVITGSEAGAWRAGENSAMPGIIMPGTFLLGSRYFQELAAPVAADRGENTAMGLTVETDAGTFYDCVEVTDTNPLGDPPVCDKDDGDVKVYCPGVGLVMDEDLELVKYGKGRFYAHDNNGDDVE